MKNKILISTILFIAVLIFSFYALSQEKSRNQIQTNRLAEQEIQQSNDQGQISNSEPQENSTTNQKNNSANQGNQPTNQPVNQKNSSASQIILFYGEGCPHCAKVKEYIQKNNLHEKIFFVEKEVYYNQDNAKELLEKAKICGIPTNSIGVPFLWENGKCFVGDKDIIDFFKQKTNS